ncbi:hypothetical protein B0H13DRAFT_1854700 [Mycena leptocephala]|nr:hypothetical protein B0H13DRAFT_1854700 [Mycena leptocephala]
MAQLSQKGTIISFKTRSFQLPSASDSDDRETVYFNDHRGSGPPPGDIGTPGDTYIDVNASTLYACCVDGWMPWLGPTKRLESLPHPTQPNISFWCNTTQNGVSWMPISEMRMICTSGASASEVVADIIAAEASKIQKRLKRKPDDDVSCDDSDSDQAKRARVTKSPTPPTAPAAPAVLAWRRCQINSPLPASTPTRCPSSDTANQDSLPPLIPIRDFSVNPIPRAPPTDTPPTVVQSAPVIANFIHTITNPRPLPTAQANTS